MRVTRLRIIAPVLLLCGLAACGHAATASFPHLAPCPSTHATPEPGPSYHYPHQEGLNDRALAIEALGQRDYPRHYGGVEIDNEHVRVVVYRVPNAAFDVAARAVPGIGCVELRDTSRPEKDLRNWQDQLVADYDYWAGRGIPMNHHPSLERGCVVVGISEPDRDGPIIKAKYPNAIFCVERAEVPGVVDLAGAAAL